MQFLVFLSSAKEVVKDHITFLYTRQFMVDGGLELYDIPLATILPSDGNANGIRHIEKLLKPTTFSTEDSKPSVKRKFHLNSFLGPHLDRNSNSNFRQPTPNIAFGHSCLMPHQRNSFGATS